MNKFGQLIRYLRKSRNKTIDEMAGITAIPGAKLHDLENGLRRVPALTDIDKILSYLKPTETQRYQVYDAAGEDRGTIPPDIESIIIHNPIIIKAVRTADKCTVSEGDWQEFIDRIQQKRTRTYPIPKKIQTKLEKPVTLLK